MAALATLSTTTFARAVERGDTMVSLASRANVVPGQALYAGTELLKVIAYGAIGSGDVLVLRGQGGTASQFHVTNQAVTIGRQDQFYLTDPIGPPPSPVLVSPWINVLTGKAWVPQGDQTGANETAQWWAPTEITHGTGALGIRTTTSATGIVTNT